MPLGATSQIYDGVGLVRDSKNDYLSKQQDN